TVYVTHDQTEAMTLGDRVAVMRAGVLQQVGSPMELYNTPRNLFVAGFIGSPAMNFMPATIEGDTIKLPMADAALPPGLRESVGRAEGSQLIAGIRPESFEDASLVDSGHLAHGTRFKTNLELVESMGAELYVHFKVTSDAELESDQLRELAEDSGAGEVPRSGEEGEIVARLNPESKATQGQELELWLDSTHIHLFEASSGDSLTSS
ncbi:MAG TPA: ABC transporter ATP-binding protein, partial [Thermoleophilaceae bacterium]|nr:ABC transporter ATP-binding protein [Thermoleophilaceae bacterium]